MFVLGLCFGSFVNMLIYRVAINYKLKKTTFAKATASQRRSFCDYCGRQLGWYENIPVISWVIQKGKTRCCGKKLSVLYPVVEMLMGALFVINYLVGVIHKSPLHLILGLVIIVFLVFSGMFDLKFMILPDFSTVILVICALALWFIRNTEQWNYFWSSILSFGFLGLLYLITKKKGIGFGDVKLAIFMGLFLGYPKIIVAFYIAFVVGAIVSLVLIFFKKASRKTQIPFGPFLIFGTLIAWWWGNLILGLSVFQFIR